MKTAALVAMLTLTAPPVVIVPDLPPTKTPDQAAVQAGLKAYQRATKAWRRGRLKAALEAARQAWSEVPNASTALIVATIAAELKDSCTALTHLLLAADLDPSPEERAAIHRDLPDRAKGCAPGYSWARLETDPPTATLTLAGHLVPATRLIAVAAGTHPVTIEAPDRLPKTDEVTFVAGSATRSSWALKEKPQPIARPEPVPKPKPKPIPVVLPTRPPPDRTTEYALIGTGAAALALGATSLALAFTNAAEAKDLHQDPTAEDDYNAARTRSRIFEGTAYGLAGLGAGALVWGLVLLTSPADAALNPSPGGATLTVSF